jgi:hypothetical protein
MSVQICAHCGQRVDKPKADRAEALHYAAVLYAISRFNTGLTTKDRAEGKRHRGLPARTWADRLEGQRAYTDGQVAAKSRSPPVH